GLPAPLPDVLGLALRWEQETGPAELLLATTGHGLVGRHLLRPARKWSPGFYGSLLPYEANGRHVLLGALAREPALPADLELLARAVRRRPITLDLVVATETGPWERFGELVLTGPARSDGSEPIRFEPARHPIAELPPAGAFQRMREPVYAAVQSVGRRGGVEQ
ncbi:hypothetical protein ACFQ07_12090, partial [Actinomadura adrarensis]